MRASTLIPFATLFLTLAADALAQSLPPASERFATVGKGDLFDRVVTNQKKSEQALDVYERIERLETRKTSADAPPSSVKVARVIPSGTGLYRIPVGPDGKPTDAAAYRAELEGFEKALALAANPGKSQREGIEKYAKRKKDRADLIDATRSAFLYTFVGREPRAGRMLARYKMEPNPAYKPTSRFTSIFAKVHGFIWIDEDSEQLARVEGEVTEDISLGLFLAKIYKGSHFMQERYEFAPGLWLPSFSQYDFDGRKFFSSFFVHERTFYSNYRYIGSPKEALLAIRAELGKPASAGTDP